MEALGFIEVCFLFSPIILIAIFSILGSKKENEIRQNYINRMQRFYSSENNNNNNNNNNRHAYIYQDVEKEIIKVDHTFSKETFLNNAKELFCKYYNCMANENCEELKQYVTTRFFNITRFTISKNKSNNIKVVADNIYIYIYI